MSWHKLHDIQPCQTWPSIFCGPAAIMTITGKDHLQVCRALNRTMLRNRDARVRGVYNWCIVRTLERMGLKITAVGILSKPTLWNWVMNHRTPKDKRALFLVSVTGHYVVINGFQMNDNHTKKPVMIDDMPWKKKRVRNVWRINKS